jgi:hypothetical protein
MANQTDQQVLTEIQYDVLEAPDNGATFPSGVWTPTEVLEYLNQRQRRFVSETRILIGRTSFTVGAGTERTDVNAIAGLEDVYQIIRVAYIDTAGVYHPIPASDLFGADMGNPSWATASAALPLAFSVTDGTTTELIFMPAPTSAGTVWLHFVPRLPNLDATGERLSVIGELGDAVKWGVLADMLGKPGRMHDPQRAEYCDQRYQELVGLAQQMVEGIE